ncbi:hypothetical protein ALC57_03285 [Trachymyrmex cornetzi]|uniref:Uncharacterized protein n=1 Tax=Trachymyrmex cornetzi TaxID=471704 RepID=A0A195EGC6_9HYME|nr:hypothetical protein ALC57_03285 [Trachymyrmex cornetzi]
MSVLVERGNNLHAIFSAMAFLLIAACLSRKSPDPAAIPRYTEPKWGLYPAEWDRGSHRQTIVSDHAKGTISALGIENSLIDADRPRNPIYQQQHSPGRPEEARPECFSRKTPGIPALSTRVWFD